MSEVCLLYGVYKVSGNRNSTRDLIDFLGLSAKALIYKDLIDF